MSMYLFSSALSAAIQEACTPSLNDPYLIWPFAATAIARFCLRFGLICCIDIWTMMSIQVTGLLTRIHTTASVSDGSGEGQGVGNMDPEKGGREQF